MSYVGIVREHIKQRKVARFQTLACSYTQRSMNVLGALAGKGWVRRWMMCMYDLFSTRARDDVLWFPPYTCTGWSRDYCHTTQKAGLKTYNTIDAEISGLGHFGTQCPSGTMGSKIPPNLIAWPDHLCA